MAQYAKLIFNNWSYYSGLSTTKVKKPYLEQLIFRGLEYGLVPILRSVGVFPKLVDINIIPKLEFFNDSYNKNQNKNKEIKGMVKWIGEELIKLAPTSTPIEDKKDSKPKAPKLVPRDVNELLLTSLVQEGQKNKSLLLPHVVACMIRFVQTYDMRIESPVFLWVIWLTTAHYQLQNGRNIIPVPIPKHRGTCDASKKSSTKTNRKNLSIFSRTFSSSNHRVKIYPLPSIL